MKTVSLKIDDSVFVETEKILSTINKPRNRYINEAIESYNNRFSKKLGNLPVELIDSVKENIRIILDLE